MPSGEWIHLYDVALVPLSLRFSTDSPEEIPLPAAGRHCQRHSLEAFGYFLSSASGNRTLPHPARTSFSCIVFTSCRWSCRSFLRLTGSIVTRSLPPLPSRTVISLRAKSISFTRKCRHSINRSPAPYISKAINLLSPVTCPSTAFTSSRVNTTGNLFGLRARITSPTLPTSRPST